MITSKKMDKIIKLAKENNPRNNVEIVSNLLAVKQDLDRLEKLEKAIKILKNKLNLNVEETFFPPAYNDMSDYGEYDWYLNVFDEFINLQYHEYELLKEVLENETNN